MELHNEKNKDFEWNRENSGKYLKEIIILKFPKIELQGLSPREDKTRRRSNKNYFMSES